MFSFYFKITALTEELRAVQSSCLHSIRFPLFNHVITQTKKLTLVKYHYYRLYAEFPSFSTDVLFLFQSLILNVKLNLVVMSKSPPIYDSFSVFVFHSFKTFEEYMPVISFL